MSFLRYLSLPMRIFLLLIFGGPVILAVLAAFRPEGEIFRYGGELSWNTLFPSRLTLENFITAIGKPNFVRQIGNTAMVSIVLACLTTVVAMLAAFAFARMQFRQRDTIFFLMMATLFIPFEAILVPLFLVVQSLGLVDSYAALILPWLGSPIAIFLLRQAMQGIPFELEEAAMIDGAGIWRIFWDIVLPNVLPALVTVWLMTLVASYDGFLWPLVAVQSDSLQVAQVSIAGIFDPHKQSPFSLAFAASLLAVGPATVLFASLQRFYIRGFVQDGLK